MQKVDALDRLDRFGPMRREDEWEDTEIEREEPHEDEREYGAPVG